MRFIPEYNTQVAELPSPDKRWFASLDDGNIVLRATIDDRTINLTADGTPDFSWEIGAPRLKLAGSRTVGELLVSPWSPDSNWLFAIKGDRRAVPSLPLGINVLRNDGLSALAVAIAATVASMHWSFFTADTSFGAMWPQILATSAGYGVFLLVLVVAIFVRRAWLRR